MQNSTSNEVNAPTTFYWVPLGTASTGNTIEKISDEAADLPVATISRVPLPSDKHIRELVGLIEQLLGKQIDRTLKKQLIGVLLKMQVEEYENESHDEQSHCD